MRPTCIVIRFGVTSGGTFGDGISASTGSNDAGDDSPTLLARADEVIE